MMRCFGENWGMLHGKKVDREFALHANVAKLEKAFLAPYAGSLVNSRSRCQG